MKCPHCKNVQLTMSERQGIEIDYCPTCRGIWLDRGELDKIIEKTNLDTTRSSLADRGDYRNDSHDHKPYKKKKSFFEELFD